MSDANLSYSCKKTELVKLFFVLLYFCSGIRLFLKVSYPFNIVCIAAFCEKFY